MTDLNKSKIFNRGNISSQTVYMIKEVDFATTRLYVRRGPNPTLTYCGRKYNPGISLSHISKHIDKNMLLKEKTRLH